jgi:hypothetical protein
VARTGLVWQLRDRGVDARMPADEDNARGRLGEEVTATDDEVDGGVLLLVSGAGADEDQGGRLLARSDASPEDRREELLATRDRLVDLLERERPTLTPRGEARPEADEVRALLDSDPTALVDSRYLQWVDLEFLELPGSDPDLEQDVIDYRRWYLERQFRLELLPPP